MFVTQAAALASGMMDKLDQPGHYTLFAPTNEAFDRLGPGYLERIMGDKAVITGMLYSTCDALWCHKLLEYHAFIDFAVQRVRALTVHIFIHAGLTLDGSRDDSADCSSWKISTTAGRIGMKFSTDFHGPQLWHHQLIKHITYPVKYLKTTWPDVNFNHTDRLMSN